MIPTRILCYVSFIYLLRTLIGLKMGAPQILTLYKGNAPVIKNNANDFIANDEIDSYLPLDDQYIPDSALPVRSTQDVGGFEHEWALNVGFRESSGFRILNGRINESKSGNFTCYNANGCSIVDYALCTENLFDRISPFEIGNINELSDHAPIEIAFRTNVDMSRKRDSPASSSNIIKDSNLLIKMSLVIITYIVLLPMKIPLRMHALKSDDVKDFLDHITNELDDPQVPVEVSVAKLHRKLLEISKSAIPSKILFTQKGKKKSKRIQCPWFDESCRLAKTQAVPNLNKSRKS